jgi:Ca-activated chloride channel family protein
MVNKVLFIFIFILNNLIILFIYYIQNKKREKIFKENKIYLKIKNKIFLVRLFLLFIINFLFFLLILDLKGGKKKVEIKDNFSDATILIDVSTSMRAEDIYPNRLEVSLLLANKLVNKVKNTRFSLIIFSKEPYIQIPFTTDIKYFSYILNGLKIENLGTSYINNALSKAYFLLIRTPGKLKYIIILSDMEFWEKIDKNLLNIITGEGIKIIFFIVGTYEGSKIIINNDYLRDKNGEVVISKPNFSIKEELKSINNLFFYYINKVDFESFDKILEDVFEINKQGKKYIIVNYKYYSFFAIVIFILFVFYLLIYSRILIKIDYKDEFKIYK